MSVELVWTYFAIRVGSQGLVQTLMRSAGARNEMKAEVYHRKNGWTQNFKMWSELRWKGELDDYDRITEEQAERVIQAWKAGEPALLGLTQEITHKP